MVVDVPIVERQLSYLLIKSRGRRNKISNQMKACNKYDSFDPGSCNNKKRADISYDTVGCSSKFGQTSRMIDEEVLWIKNAQGIYILNFFRC